MRFPPSARRQQAVRDFPEGFYADRCLHEMGAAPAAPKAEFRPLASTRLDPRFLLPRRCPNTDGPILLVRLEARG
jgi:hypothetical protein